MNKIFEAITNEYAGQIILIAGKDSKVPDANRFKSFWITTKGQYAAILKDAERAGYDHAIIFHYEINKKALIDFTKK